MPELFTPPAYLTDIIQLPVKKQPLDISSLYVDYVEKGLSLRQVVAQKVHSRQVISEALKASGVRLRAPGQGNGHGNPSQLKLGYKKERGSVVPHLGEQQVVGAIKGFKDFPELDSVIQFWLQYWKEFGLSFPSDIDPLVIKAIIAKESSFRPKASAKGSTAYGLMQITDKTRRDIRNINDGILDLERKDLEDPVISIAMGIRWLSYKYSSIGKGVKKDLYNTIKYYYDKNKGDDYAIGKFCTLIK